MAFNVHTSYKPASTSLPAPGSCPFEAPPLSPPNESYSHAIASDLALHNLRVPSDLWEMPSIFANPLSSSNEGAFSFDADLGNDVQNFLANIEGHVATGTTGSNTSCP
jgi:hypothetical protein